MTINPNFTNPSLTDSSASKSPGALSDILHANRLLSVKQIRAIEERVIADHGDDGFILMQQAAAAACKIIRMNMPNIRSIGIVTGGGNNGGDGYMIAAILQEFGLSAAIWSLTPPKTSASKQARYVAEQANVSIHDCGDIEDSACLDSFCLDIQNADVEIWLDCLLGIGLSKPVSTPFGRVIDSLNRAKPAKISMDMPSGLAADNGCCLGSTVKATMTITFIAHKRGQFTADGPDYVGDLVLASLDLDEQVLVDVLQPDYVQPISIDQPDLTLVERASWLQCRRVEGLLPARMGNSHKGMFGHSLIIGGAEGMAGAAIICSESALRCGSGKVSCATDQQTVAPLLARTPEVMVKAVRTGQQLPPLLTAANAVAIGPGLGLDSWAQLMMQQALASELPLVIDADALRLASQQQQSVCDRSHATILTPHVGEALQLINAIEHQNWTAADIQASRIGCARLLALHYQATVILKGQGSVIASADGRCAICSDGNPGMASGGMGDALTGVIVALLAQGLTDWQAATLATCIHSHAADQAQQPGGQRGMTATDLMPWLRQLSNI